MHTSFKCTLQMYCDKEKWIKTILINKKTEGQLKQVTWLAHLIYILEEKMAFFMYAKMK